MQSEADHCCGQKPQSFRRDGEDHIGDDFGFKCLVCGRDWHFETMRGTPTPEQMSALVTRWNKAVRRKEPIYD